MSSTIQLLTILHMNPLKFFTSSLYMDGGQVVVTIYSFPLYNSYSCPPHTRIYIYILSIPLRELLAVIGPKGPAADGVFQEQDFIVVDPYGVKGDGQNLRYGDIICLRTPEVCLSLVAHAEIFNVLSYYTLSVFVCEYIHEYVC